ncbi:hypothetical protein SAMN04487910_2223 [Aquimarina amphilecti]|uniref:Uncharacterized protein n=1 Tax=Aquimarina amphilecti TaxID=1038014 RepID=A0A1H7PIY4_AQUAM|nr:hypothetical protein [Aquimarina amphilecti]SEL35579.1 hypothetical protein SAMN04487910_2223 [Aquimarina amphilecti]
MLKNILKLEGINSINKKQQKTIKGGIRNNGLQIECEPEMPFGCQNGVKAYGNSDVVGNGSTCYIWICQGSGDTGPDSPHNL